MSEPSHCPRCGTPLPDPVGALTAEVERIREIAQSDSTRRIEELTGQVRALQETVARLRGHATAGYR